MLPKNRPTHPGEFIKEDIIKELPITQEQLANKLGVSRRTINQLVNGKRRISVDLALRIGRFTNTTPEMWLNLQASVDIWDAHNSPSYSSILKIQPIPAG